jgi:glycosyltransferase involved in cell wall biosynthesis
VVIPAYYRPELLEKAVRSCLSQSLPPERYEVIVVDSSGNDDNVKLVQTLQHDSACPLTCLSKPPEGPGPSRNLGGRHARGKYLAFMDSDCQASFDWLRAGIAAFEPGTGLVQGKTIPEPGVPLHTLSRSFRIEHESFIYEALNIFYRRDVFLERGGFAGEQDPTAMSVLGGEDVDLAWRVKRAGWASRFAADAVVTHVVERITVWQWLYDRRMIVIPRIPRDFPETRRFFFAKYFYDDVQAYLLAAIVALALALYFPPTLLGVVPYFVRRGAENTRALRGPLRILRPLVYFPRDTLTLVTLLRGCVKYRALLL